MEQDLLNLGLQNCKEYNRRAKRNYISTYIRIQSEIHQLYNIVSSCPNYLDDATREYNQQGLVMTIDAKLKYYMRI